MEIKLRTIIGRMNRLNLLHRLHIHKVANASGLYFGQLPILETVKKNPNCTQKQICDILQVSPPSIATSIKRMQKMGFLQKTEDKKDLRCTHILLTKKGEEATETCRSAFDKIDEQMFKGFSEAECEQLYSYIERLIENLSIDDEYKNQTFFSLMAKMENLQKQKEKEDKND